MPAYPVPHPSSKTFLVLVLENASSSSASSSCLRRYSAKTLDESQIFPPVPYPADHPGESMRISFDDDDEDDKPLGVLVLFPRG